MTSEAALAAKSRGNGFFKAKDYDNAIREYSQAIELEPAGPKSHTFFSNRSACYAGKEDFDLALADAEKCIELQPDFVKGYSRKGYALYKLNRLDEAEAAYKDGLSRDPNNQSLKEGLQETEQAKSGGGRGGGLFGPEIWMLIHNDPELREMAKDPAFVQKVKILQSNPQAFQMMAQDPQILKLLEKMLGGRMNFGGGAEDAGDAPPPPQPTRETPPSKPPTQATSDEKDNDGDSTIPDAPSAEAEQKEAAKPPTPEPEEPPIDPEVLAKQQQALQEKQRGTELYKEKNFEDALLAYQRAAELDPTKPVYFLNQSAVLFMQQRWDDCLEACQRAIACADENISRDNPTWKYKAFKRMGDVEEKRGAPIEVIEKFYNQALLEKKDNKLRDKIKKMKKVHKAAAEKAYLDPEKALEHRTAGNEHFKAGRNQEAIVEYTESLRRNPNDAKVYSNRAIAFCKMMAWGEALDDCEKAIRIEPDFIKPWIRKAKIYNAIQQYHKAVKALQMASKIDKNDRNLMETRAATMQGIQRRNASGEMDDATRQRALEDEEVREAMNDAEVSSVLTQARADPSVLMRAMADRPHIADKIEILMAAGVIALG